MSATWSGGARRLLALSCFLAFSSALIPPTRLAPYVHRSSIVNGRREVVALSAEAVEMKGRIHEIGGRFKTLATAAKRNIASASPPLKVLYAGQCIALYFLFVIYRAYRGFFIIIPAVFKEVQGRLTAGLVEAESELNADLDPSTGKLRTRSAILISIGASAVTLIYTLKTIGTGFVKGTKNILNILCGGKHSSKTSQNIEVKPPTSDSGAAVADSGI